MNLPTRRDGATLPELLILLALLSILMGMSISVSTGVRDGIAVRSARDEAAAWVARAAALARLHGSARLWVHEGTLRIEAPAGVPGAVYSIGEVYGVDTAVDGAGGAVALEFDALGLGRLANRTIRFRRNDAEAGITLSSYGRPRRW